MHSELSFDKQANQNFWTDIVISYANDDFVTKVHSWCSFVINAIVPFILLCSMNYAIIQKVRQSHRMFGDT